MKSKMDFIPVYCSMADIAVLLKEAGNELNKDIKDKSKHKSIELTQELLEQILVKHFGFDDKFVVYNEELDCMTFYSTMNCLHKPRNSNLPVKCQRFDGKERTDAEWLSNHKCSLDVWFSVKNG